MYNCSACYGQSSSSYGNSSGSYASSAGYSGSNNSAEYNSIDSLVSESIETHRNQNGISFYSALKYGIGTYLTKQSQNVEFGSDDFLNPNRPATVFVQDEKIPIVTDAIKDTFKLMTGEDLPNNLKIHILNEDEFIKAHSRSGGKWSEGIMGFSLNSQGRGANEVFAKKDFLDRLMLTIGHEIGHVMSPSLGTQHDEEAKAFAFSLAWMQTIVDNNIAGLSQNINPMPARNGLHNIAFDFVAETVNTGKKAIEIFKELVVGNISVFNQIEKITI